MNRRGGVARRATLIDSLQALEEPLVHLDLGNFMSTSKPGKELRSRHLWNEMIRLNVVATTPGPRELAEWNLFSEFLAEGEIPVVSSNLRRKTDGGETPLADRSLIVEENGIRLGLIGLIGGNEFANARIPDGLSLSFSDPAEVAKTLVDELAADVDLIVLLSQMSTDHTDLLLEAVPGIDVALYGNRAPFVDRAERLGGTIVNMTGNRGQYVGSLTIIVSPEGEIVEFGSENGSLDKRFRKDPLVLAAASDVEREVEDLKQAERGAVASTKPPTEFFLGAETCRRCHPSQFDQWAETPHARAFATLETDHGMSKTEDCARCHVTGFDHPSGYVPTSTSPNLENVQCEACHGPGTEHVRTRGQVKMSETTCTNCHTGEFAKDWNFDEYYDLVVHGPQ